MKFSIVTPSFNQGRYIRDCIESVKSQEGVDWEHIIIDACSTDETLDVIKEYPHLQWVSEPDKGQTDAINKGFAKTGGNWVMWLNADDYLLPQALLRVAEFTAVANDADVIYGDCDFVDEEKQLIRHRFLPPFTFNLLLFDGCYIQSTACFYRRKIIDEGFALDPSMKVCMDYEYYLRLAHHGFRFAHFPERLAAFRWHDTNISSSNRERRIQERRQLQRHFLRLRGRPWLGGELSLQFLKGVYRVIRRLRTPSRSNTR